MGLDVCRFMTPEDLGMRLDVCRFMTPEDLDMANGSLVTTCGVSVWANAGGLDHEEEAPTGVEDPSRHVRPMASEDQTGGGARPGGGARAQATRQHERRGSAAERQRPAGVRARTRGQTGGGARPGGGASPRTGGGGCTPLLEPTGVRTSAEPAGVRTPPNRRGCIPRGLAGGPLCNFTQTGSRTGSSYGEQTCPPQKEGTSPEGLRERISSARRPQVSPGRESVSPAWGKKKKPSGGGLRARASHLWKSAFRMEGCPSIYKGFGEWSGGVRGSAGVRKRMPRGGGPPDQWGRPTRPGLKARQARAGPAGVPCLV
ncbi:hypothetical protein Taro_018408 [Colocasia esculenta]|uniref:Uncharacterized protein n=1 Tax=Colocasia esculenta TaxID=4460 RepID=A0A843V2C9_COLES|nr:hypothetical protein [Colocasia esculenta]